MERWWINGEPGSKLDVTDRGLAYGDGLFETVAIRDGEPRFLGHHLDRLLHGCQRLRLPPPDRAGLAADLGATAAGLQHGVLKLIVTRGPGPRGYRLPAAPVTTVAWGTAATEPQPSRPIRIRWCETMASVNPATAGLKTLGRLDQVLARAEWSQPDVTDGLMISTEGRLIGGTASNVFLVIGGRLLTPALGRAGIAGVMRRVVLEAARDAGIAVCVSDLPPSAVAGASEVFLTNALTGIRPVHRLDAQAWSTGPVTCRLQEKLFAAGVTECAG
ncbi:MAG: aminodeoxychorismate lyase [Chromatiales bacterium]|nr:aminodeoxychorismate lyase [Chromatiales bacterium]